MSFQERWPPAPGTESSSRRRRSEDGSTSTSPVFETLADRTRRRIVGALLERDGAVQTTALAAELAASDDVAPADPQDLRVELRHVHLPALASVPLVRWDRDSGTVRAADHPALDDDTLRRVAASGADVDGVLDALADERRRLVLAVLYAYGGPIDRSTVLEKVAELEAEGSDRDPEPDSELRVSLAHVHLPKLDDAGLVRRDAERGTVQYVGHPDVDENWFAF